MLNNPKTINSNKLAAASFCICSPSDLQPFGECICGAPKNGNKVKQRIEVLRASIAHVDYKLKHLTPYFSQLQIRVWRKHRRTLARELKFLEGVLKLAKNQITASQILADIKQGRLTLLQHLTNQARKQEAHEESLKAVLSEEAFIERKLFSK